MQDRDRFMDKFVHADGQLRAILRGRGVQLEGEKGGCAIM
jgi:hypothetical protein